MFEKKDPKQNTENQIIRLRQTGDIARYVAAFQALRVQCDWGNSEFITQFYNGLKDYVKNKISRVNRSGDFSEIITLALKINRRIQQRSQKKKKQGSTQHK